MNNFPSPVHLEMITRGERGLANVEPLLAKAEACGVPCEEFRAAAADLRRAIASFRGEFFPNQITPDPGTGVPIRGE